MGEIAEMMIDGTMCAGCGEFLHDGEDGPGFPGYCESCSPHYEGDAEVDEEEVKKIAQSLGKKLRKALAYPITLTGGMYPGCHWSDAPATFTRLERMGLIETYHPHNLVHKSRAVHTDKGEAVYAMISGKKAKS